MNSSEMAKLLRNDPKMLAILEREARAMAELVDRHEEHRQAVERLMARLRWDRRYLSGGER